MCGKLLALPLKMNFEATLTDGVFLEDCKKGNIAPVHKKGLKNMLINYRPIGLLSTFPMIFENIIFMSMLIILSKINFSQLVSWVFF